MTASPVPGRSAAAPKFRVVPDLGQADQVVAQWIVEHGDNLGRCANALETIAALMSTGSLSTLGRISVGELAGGEPSVAMLLGHASRALAAARQGADVLDMAAVTPVVAMARQTDVVDHHTRPGRLEQGRPVDQRRLSPRERELLALLGQGLTDREIANALGIALSTVHSHLDRIRDKTGRRKRSQLTRLALDLGLLVDNQAVAQSG
jgi:DNA-binding CsgD family transcriptional regulator